MNTNVFIENAIRNAPEKTGLVCDGKAYTYQDIFCEINKLTNALLQIGCKKGSRISILAKNSMESIILYYASARIGAIFIPLDYKESHDNLIAMIHHVEPEFLFVDNDCLNTCISIHHFVPSVKYFISINKPHAHYLYYKLLVDRASDEYYCYLADDDDPTAILFTSGTTGARKAVAFSHINFIHHVLNTGNHLPKSEDIVSLVCVPFYHILGFQAITTAFYYCHKLILIRSFSPEYVLRVIEKEKISQTLLPPSKMSSILQCSYLKDADLSHLRNIKVGGDISYAPLILEALEKFPPHVKFSNVYGLTEATYDIAALNHEDHNLHCFGKEKSQKIIRLNSIGRPLAQVKLIIADERGNELPCGEIGELLVHTQRHMIGYVSPVTHEIEENNDFWIHTSDIGYHDEDGYIFMLGQKVDTLANQNDKYSPVLSPNFIVYPCVTNNQVEMMENAPEIDMIKPIINQRTYFPFLRYLRHLYEAQSVQQLSEKYLSGIAEFIPASSFGIHLLPLDDAVLTHLENENPLKWDMPYFDTLPLYAAQSKVEEQKKTLYQQTLSQFLSVQDYIEKIKPDHLICAPLFTSQRKLMGVLSFGRIGTNWKFNQYEQNLIRMISSHMCTALTNTLERDILVSQKKLLENIIQVTGIPVLVTTPAGEILYENQYAHIILERDLLGNSQSRVLEIVKKNIDLLNANNIRQVSQPTEASFLLEKLNYIIKTTVADFYPLTYISTISETEEQFDFTFLQNVLTEREIHILTLIAQGCNNADIASALYISVNTVKYHLKNIFQKLEVTTRTELLTKAYALNSNITRPVL